MRSTPITTHVIAAKARLLQQYKDQANIGDIIEIQANRIQGIEDLAQVLFTRLDIDGSAGQQLNNIGELVGQLRKGQTDTVYRLFLKAKAAQNVSHGDIPRILDVWQIITQSTIIQLLEAFPAEVDLYYDVPLDDSLVTDAFELIQNVVAGGVRVGFIAVYEPGLAFTLDDDVVGDDGTIDTNEGLGSAIAQGANTSVSPFKLIDNTQTFLTKNVTNQMVVYNTNDDSDEIEIISVDSEIQLTLDSDEFTAFPKEYYVNENVGGQLAYLQAP